MAKNSKEVKNEIYLTYTENRSGGGIRDGYEDAAFPCFEPENIDFNLTGAWRTSKDWVETVEVDFDITTTEKVYIVVVRYSTGNTFSTTYGQWQIQGAYNDRGEAETIAKSINNDSYDGYKPWNGYFESFEEVSVESMTLDEGRTVYTRDPVW